MRFNSIQLKEIRQSLNLADIIARQVSLKSSGGKLKGRCPFHDEKTPSFFVDQNRYYCFGCQARGDVFDYFMNMEGLTFPQAVERAASEAGYDLKELDPKEEEALRRREARRNALYELNEEATAWFEKHLQGPEGALARSYLTERGITKEFWERYRLGYAPDSWDAFCATLSAQKMPQALTLGLVRKAREKERIYDFYRHRIMFPIRDSSGHVRGFSSRILDPERKEGKYVNSPESEIFKKFGALYGLYSAKKAIRKNRMAILVEGNLDVIAMAQAGYENTVAPLGTAVTQRHLKLVKRFAEQTCLMFDGDDAGRNATLKTISLMVEAKMEGKVVLLPQGEDPDSIINKDGADGMGRRIERAQPPIETFLSMSLPPASAPVTEKLGAIQRVAPLLQRVGDAQLPVYAQEVAIRLGLNQKEVISIIRQALEGSRYATEEPAPAAPVNTREAVVDADILALLHIAVLGVERNSNLPVDHLSAIGNSFSNTVAMDLWRIMAHLVPPVSEDRWQELLGPYYKRFKEVRTSFVDGQAKPMSDQEKDAALAEVIISLRRRGLAHRSKMLDFALRAAQKDGDQKKIEALFKEKLELQKERIDLK